MASRPQTVRPASRPWPAQGGRERALFFGFRPLSEALHIRSAATSLASEPEIASPWMEAIMLIKAQRTGIVGIAVVVAIGLIWSVVRSAAVIQP
jgi:hypothetical protein